HRLAALLQPAQVYEALTQSAQLHIIESAGGLLAVTGDEGHRRTAIEQGDGGHHLRRLDREFIGNADFDRGQHDAVTSLGRRGRELCRMRQGPTRLAFAPPCCAAPGAAQAVSRAAQSLLMASATSVQITPESR